MDNKEQRRSRKEQKHKSELGSIFGVITLLGVIITVIVLKTSGSPMVAGVSIKRDIPAKTTPVPNPESAASVAIKENAQERLEQIKEQVSNLSVSDMVSSSPQVDKIIKDLQGLQQYPKNQVKDACFKICEGL
ncbi:MAG: hypothetical protein HY430_01025 [Candidatus Levybacteria bacterium]|nr:hypothetical protein [Candidatus Levybacteria bacterium]